MAASTNTVILETEDGERVERDGVLYAEQVVDAKEGASGVAIQYREEVGVNPEVEFVPDASLVGVYDEVADDPPAENFKMLVTE